MSLNGATWLLFSLLLQQNMDLDQLDYLSKCAAIGRKKAHFKLLLVFSYGMKKLKVMVLKVYLYVH